MSETQRAGGVPGQIDWDGRTLKVQRVTFKVEGSFEAWLEANLDAALERSRANCSPEVYRDRLEAANRQVAAREFAWEGEVARKAAREPAGFRELSFWCLFDLQPGWTRAEHERLLADPGKCGELVRVIHKVSAPHPNGSAPGGEPSGATTSPPPNFSASSSPTPTPA